MIGGSYGTHNHALRKRHHAEDGANVRENVDPESAEGCDPATAGQASQRKPAVRGFEVTLRTILHKSAPFL